MYMGKDSQVRIHQLHQLGLLQDTLRQISERSTSGNICSFIAVGALSIGDIMAIFKAMAANYF